MRKHRTGKQNHPGFTLGILVQPSPGTVEPAMSSHPCDTGKVAF